MITSSGNEQIDKLKESVRHCTLCRLSETRKHAVPPEGDPNARILIVAQAPGREEDQEGRMFIGPSGEVLNRLFDQVGIDRREIYMTNLLKCFLPNCRKPRADEIEACSVYLDQEIEQVNPGLIVPLGYHPTKNILQRYGLEVPNRHGFPSLFGQLKVAGRRKILPLRHPATVVHQSAQFDTLRENYRKLKITGTTCKWYEVCPMRVFYEQGKLSKYWIDRYCHGDWESCIRFRMEESGRPHSDNMLPDGSHDNNL